MAALAVLLAGAATARAQESGSVRGRVVDAATQRPLDGAQITIQGTRFGGMANQNGDFLILNVPAGTYTVRAQMLGYNRQDVEVTIAAGQAAVTSFELRQAAIDLDAIVVTGTAGGTVRRALGNSVTRLETGDLTEQAPIANVQELLTARAPGVTLMSSSGQAGASSKIRIRGASSLSAGNEPVFYVDGVRVAAGTNGGYGVNNGTVQGTNPLDYLNPDDIESIEVIKGPAAATLYGADAAAGVIQIITKKGRASQGVQFTAEVEMGSSEWALDMPTNYTLCTTSAEASAIGAPFLGNRLTSSNWPGCGEFDASQPLQQRLLTQQPARDDPQALRVGDIRGMSVSARGGNEAFNFYLSADNYDEDGVFFNNFSKRTSGRGNFGFVPSDKLNFNVSVGYARTHAQMPLQNNASNSILRNAFRGRPGNQGPWGVGWRGFIPEISNQYDNQTWQERTTVGLTMNYTPLPGFTNRLTLGMDRNDRTNQSFMRQDTTGRAPWGAVSATGTIDRYLPSIHVWTLDYASTLANDLTPDLNS
ncbi:MAG: TonB-dependent receptor plug domain-containing protein, partial [Gammaproteobacteria bacterium]|nr:TonB-dependent receptor plug domain-containing protein [Gammaproteobacteria bacterium]